MTPEGKVKEEIKKLLAGYEPLTNLWYDMPVPRGFGRSQLDFTLCFCGLFLAIEAKAPGEWLTGGQKITAWNMYCAHGSVFIISNHEGIAALRRWMERVYDRATALGTLHSSNPKPVSRRAAHRKKSFGHTTRFGRDDDT